MRPGLARDTLLAPPWKARKANSLARHVLLCGAPGPGGRPHLPVGKEARNEPGHCRRPSPALLATFYCEHTGPPGSGQACRRQQGRRGLRPLPRKAAAAPLRARNSEGGSANVTAANAWPPQDGGRVRLIC